jgi:hypothetical protein
MNILNVLEGFGLGILACLSIWFIGSPFKSIGNKQNKIEIFRLPNNNFHIIINGIQYRFVENTKNFAASNIYYFPSGVKHEDNDHYNKFHTLIFKFKESEQAEERRKLYEAEMFLDMSDSFSKWDKEFSTKALNK